MADDTLRQSWILWAQGKGPKPKKPPPAPKPTAPPEDPEFERAKRNLTEGYPRKEGEMITTSVPGKERIEEEIRAPTLKERVRHGIADMPLAARLGVESAPAGAGTALGLGASSALSLLPIPGARAAALALRYPMAGAGGYYGEKAGQEMGISPDDYLAQLMGGAFPTLFGGGSRALSRLWRGFVQKFPGAPIAVERLATEEADEVVPQMRRALVRQPTDVPKRGRLGRLADRFTGRPPGVEDMEKMRAGPTAGFYYNRQRKANIPLGEEDIPKIRKGIKQLREQFNAAGRQEFPEGRQIRTVLDQAEETLSRGDFDMNGLVNLTQNIGEAYRRWRRTGGPKFGAVKKLYRDIHDNLRDLAKGPRTAEAAKAAKDAIAQARREFAVNGLFEDFAGAFRVIPGEGAATKFNPAKALQRFKDSLNPDHKQYSRNLEESLTGEEKEMIREFLTWANKSIGKKGMVGNIVVRGQTAARGREAMKGLVGGVSLGALSGGTLGAMVGGLLGSAAPEMLAWGLMRPGARQIVKRATMKEATPGRVADTLATISQMGQAALTTDDPEGKMDPVKGSLRAQTMRGLEQIGVSPRQSSELIEDFEDYVERQNVEESR